MSNEKRTSTIVESSVDDKVMKISKRVQRFLSRDSVDASTSSNGWV
jgi:hypothetical protein